MTCHNVFDNVLGVVVFSFSFVDIFLFGSIQTLSLLYTFLPYCSCRSFGLEMNPSLKKSSRQSFAQAEKLSFHEQQKMFAAGGLVKLTDHQRSIDGFPLKAFLTSLFMPKTGPDAFIYVFFSKPFWE